MLYNIEHWAFGNPIYYKARSKEECYIIYNMEQRTLVYKIQHGT